MNEPTLPETASVHEKTVKNAQQHADAAKRPKKRNGRTRKVTTNHQLKVDPRVWETVKELCDDPSRLLIVSETEVLILNPGAKKNFQTK